jgi:hypothetical protein
MIKRLPPKPPVVRTVENIEEWSTEFLQSDETTAEELDAFVKIAEKDAEFTGMLAMDYTEMGTLLAEHENATPATISYLLEVVSEDWKGGGYILQAVPRNDTSTPEILRTLFQHGGRYVREMVVGHVNVPADILVWAAKDKRESVRDRLTYGGGAWVPDEALQYLADFDSEEHIRISAQMLLSDRVRDRKKAR